MAWFNGTAGNDVFIGNDENDSAQGFLGNDQLFGNGGNDWMSGGDGADLLDGGDGDDRVASAEVFGSFGINDPSQDYALDHDILKGGAGSDRLFAGYGDDVDGGSGVDYLSLNLLAAHSGVVLDLSSGAATIGGGTISNVENLTVVVGTAYGDYIRMVNSAPGSFSLANGHGGDDTLIAANYGSILVGEDGDDLLIAGAGIDQLDGGSGRDTFLGQAAALNGDTIGEFARGDRIIVSDATLAEFTFNLIGHQLVYTGGSLTLTTAVRPSMTLSAAPGGGVQIAFDGPPIILASSKMVSIAGADIGTARAESTDAKIGATVEPYFEQMKISFENLDHRPGLDWPRHVDPADLFLFA